MSKHGVGSSMVAVNTSDSPVEHLQPINCAFLESFQYCPEAASAIIRYLLNVHVGKCINNTS